MILLYLICLRFPCPGLEPARMRCFRLDSTPISCSGAKASNSNSTAQLAVSNPSRWLAPSMANARYSLPVKMCSMKGLTIPEEEAATGKVDLDGNEPYISEYMLESTYNKKYSDGQGTGDVITPSTAAQNARTTPSLLPASVTTSSSASSLVDRDTLLTNMKVCIIGDQLRIPDLKVLAKKEFEEIVTDRWRKASFVASLKLLYEETMENDRLMNNVAIKTAGEHVKDMCNHDELVALCKKEARLLCVLKASLTAKAAATACPYCCRND